MLIVLYGPVVATSNTLDTTGILMVLLVMLLAVVGPVCVESVDIIIVVLSNVAADPLAFA